MTSPNVTEPAWIRGKVSPALGGWLDEHCPALGTGGISLSPLSGGSSGSVLLVERGNRRAVLRAPAWPPRPDSLRALEREARILKALGQTDVPHPRYLAYCSDESIIGAPFLLIEHIVGWLGAGTPPRAFAENLPLRHQTAFTMIDGIAALARVDPDKVGLSDFGRPDGFLERQVDRWSALMEKHRQHPDYGDRQLPGFDEVGDWLRKKDSGHAPCIGHSW